MDIDTSIALAVGDPADGLFVYGSPEATKKAQDLFWKAHDVPLLEYSRLLEIMRQFGITETDTLKHRLEDWDREMNY